jgi:hypothetical protein
MARTKPTESFAIKRRRGKPALGKKPSKMVLRRLYVKEEKSIREIANLRGCTKDMVARALKEYGIEARSNASRSRLWTIPLKDLEVAIRQKGLRGAANDLGVDDSTLKHHLKTRIS